MTDRFEVRLGDCRERMAEMLDASVDSIVTDPPYGLSFMGKGWDHGVPGVEFWTEALRVAKPGAHLLAFGGTRTFHRLAVAIEDAGWQIRDCVMWVYGSGFPKSHDVSKAIDKHGGSSVAWFGPWFRKWRAEHGITQKQVAALFPSKTGGLTGCVANWELGFNLPTPEQFNLIRDTFGLPFESINAAEREVVGQQSQGKLAVAPGQDNDRSTTTLDITAPATDAAKQWQGWGTALKPAWEPVIVARKPLVGTVAANVLEHGTGAINVDGCRVEAGRWPANLIHDGSEEVVGLFPDRDGAVSNGSKGTTGINGIYNEGWGAVSQKPGRADHGSAARFFYCAKASKRDRDEGCEGLEERTKRILGDGIPSAVNSDPRGMSGGGDRIARNHHPTVKPTDLMRYLCRLVTPPDGLVLDPFCGSGSTGKGALLEGFRFIGIEREEEYAEIARARIAAAVPEQQALPL